MFEALCEVSLVLGLTFTVGMLTVVCIITWLER